jgi:hypothetical protein
VGARRSVTSVASVAIATISLWGLAGCSDDGTAQGATDFCTVLADELPVLNGDAISGAAQDRAQVAEAYQRVADAAPGGVDDDWQVLADLFERVSTTDMAEDDAFGDVFGAALSSDVKLAADRVIEHAQTECGLTLA